MGGPRKHDTDESAKTAAPVAPETAEERAPTPAPTPAEVELASVQAEVKHRGRMTTTLDRTEMAAVETEVGKAIGDAIPHLQGDPNSAVAKTNAEAQAHGAVCGEVISSLFATLDEQMNTHAVTGSIIYTPMQKKLSEELAVVAGDVQDTMRRRLTKDDPIEREIRKACGVNEAYLNPDSGFDQRNRAGRQIVALEDPENQPTFDFYQLSNKMYAARLQPKYDALKAELKKGVKYERTGDVSDKITYTLQCIEIAVERAAQFLQDHGAPDNAQKLRDKLPKRHTAAKPASQQSSSGAKTETKAETEAAAEAKTEPHDTAETEKHDKK